MKNIVKEEFEKLMGSMFKGAAVSDGQKKDIERSFYAGAIATHIAILKCSQSQNPEKDLAGLFDSIHKKGEELIGD